MKLIIHLFLWMLSLPLFGQKQLMHNTDRYPINTVFLTNLMTNGHDSIFTATIENPVHEFHELEFLKLVTEEAPTPFHVYYTDQTLIDGVVILEKGKTIPDKATITFKREGLYLYWLPKKTVLLIVHYHPKHAFGMCQLFWWPKMM